MLSFSRLLRSRRLLCTEGHCLSSRAPHMLWHFSTCMDTFLTLTQSDQGSQLEIRAARAIASTNFLGHIICTEKLFPNSLASSWAWAPRACPNPSSRQQPPPAAPTLRLQCARVKSHFRLSDSQQRCSHAMGCFVAWTSTLRTLGKETKLSRSCVPCRG